MKIRCDDCGRYKIENHKCPDVYPKHRLGMKASEETKRKQSLVRKGKFRGASNGMWKGTGVGYGALHVWIKSNKQKPEFCESCNKRKPYDLANISGEYKRDVNDFEWLCRQCHMVRDGRLEKLNLLNKNKGITKEEKRIKKQEYYIKNKESILKKKKEYYLKKREEKYGDLKNDI